MVGNWNTGLSEWLNWTELNWINAKTSAEDFREDGICNEGEGEVGDLFEQCYHSEVCPGQCQTIYQRKHIFILSEERFSNFHLLGSGYNLFNYKKIVDLINHH